MTGFDTNAAQLEEAARRAAEAGVELTLLEADFNGALPFADASFDAVVSRLAVMAAADPVATLRELARVLEPGGRLVTVLWASPAENPWFARAAGGDRRRARARSGRCSRGRSGSSAIRRKRPRHTGRPGSSTSRRVLLHGSRAAPDAAAYWAELSAENGHFRRVEASLSDDERAALLAELEERFAPYREGDGLVAATHDGARHGQAIAPPSAERGDELERRTRHERPPRVHAATSSYQ